MKHRLIWAACLLLLLPIAACQEDAPLSPAVALQGPLQPYADPNQVALAIMASTGWPAVDEDGNPVELDSATGTSPDKCNLIFVGREMVASDVAHYEFRLRVGPGQYDVIGLHRVVKERRLGVPIHTHKNIFLVHGDWKNFKGCFLPHLFSPTMPVDHSFAYFLARDGVDVWGLDQAWTFVPEGETDFAFMADWGMDTHVSWAKTATEVARIVRRLTGSGYGKLILSGYSGGSPIGFAFINDEAPLPPGQRQVGAYIPIEWGMLTDDPGWDQAMCDFAGVYQSMLDAGQYQDVIVLRSLGIPARDDPDGMSTFPGMEGLTNLQAAIALAAYPLLPGYGAHFLSGTFDADGIPTGFVYTNVDYWIDFMASAPFYEPAAYERDEYGWTCSAMGDAPWDDEFARVRVPILYVQAGGGFAPYATETLDLLGSTDKTVLNVSLIPGDPAADFGHLDLFLANDAPTLAWQPILDWIVEHTRGGPN